MDINYALYAFNVRNMGPGNRSVLWVQGCPFNCPGCIAPTHRGTGGYYMDARVMAGRFLIESDSREITISGGEPMLQAEALVEFIDAIGTDTRPGVIIYTGYKLEDLKEKSYTDFHIRELLKRTDLLIDGGYVAELDKGEIVRGSTNQKLIYLTARYDTVEMAEYVSQSRHIEIRFDNGQLKMIGIPNKSQACQWVAAKNAMKHFIENMQ